MPTVVFASINDKSHHKGKVYTACVGLLGKPNNIDMLAPTAAIVYGHKHNTGDMRFRKYAKVSDEQYERIYASLLKGHRTQIQKWINTIDQDITICCFCPSGKFCHRQLLAKWFKSYRSDLNVVLY